MWNKFSRCFSFWGDFKQTAKSLRRIFGMQDEKERGHEVQEKRAKLISHELNKTFFVGLFSARLKKWWSLVLLHSGWCKWPDKGAWRPATVSFFSSSCLFEQFIYIASISILLLMSIIV